MSKTIIKISIPALVLFLQSCNMSKHYANMRIDHHDVEMNQLPEQFKSTNERDPILVKNDIDQPVKDSVSNTKKLVPLIFHNEAEIFAQKKNINLVKPKIHIRNSASKIIRRSRSQVAKHQKIIPVKNATKDFDGATTGIIVLAVIIGIISTIVSGSGIIGFLIALGIVILIFLGIYIGISLLICGIVDAIFGI